MIANKSNQMNEILSFDSVLLSPAEQSFFSDDCLQTQHCSEITPQLASDDLWLQDFDDIRSFLGDGLELNLNNEPEFTLEAMAKEVDTQYQSKANDPFDDYSTAFMSPLSLEPSSPQRIDGSLVEHQEMDSGVGTSAMSLLEEILSANSSDSESLSDQCFDSELSIQCVTEVSKDSEAVESGSSSDSSSGIKAKRQYKRKSQSIDANIKANKRSKTTLTERRERKRNQNKSAANRYRQKKRAELDDVEHQQNQYVEANNELKAQLQKLQMEFKVVFPLAKAAFASDHNKALQLQMLDLRVLSDNLLE